jgi:nitrogen fixation protein NifU and related proteins
MATTNPLYQDIILEHYEFPRNKTPLEKPDATSRGFNSSCGDDIMVSVKLADEKCPEIGWGGHACAIGEASASMMSEAIEGNGVDNARRWIKTVRGMMTGKSDEVDPTLELGDLESLEGIKNYPVRIKCALLAWEALDEALKIAEGKSNG